MKTKKIKEKLFAFTALLFEKSAGCMNLVSDILNGDKSISVKIIDNKKGGKS